MKRRSAFPATATGPSNPKLIEKDQSRFTGFDGKILSLYVRGVGTRDIQGQLQDLYGVTVSYSLVSTVTEAGVNLAGRKELLGLWMTETKSSKFWLSVLTELQTRGRKISSSLAWIG
ncbi:hypothetical protein C7271_08975 [filamentous cyanobacterium CCP5]|nr:hypothetical protein C7271_08975 [filamentous cyanobacterium CCP5]